ncbi:proteasome activator complex subunit 3-like [Patiria miniata]|uniref:Proteasome activator complex subunit 3 n=1 Tax=Patiria miniata TaxID=46514 RepID=A0A914BMV4_PATMI|nr:proteasome activator complex subunit 3-like [Patiria miniata]
MAGTDLKKVEDFKNRLLEEAEKLVHTVFPQKIVELNELHQSETLSRSRMPEVHSKLNIPIPEPLVVINSEMPERKKRKVDEDGEVNSVQGSRVLALPDGLAPCNKHLVDIINILKPKVCLMIDHINTLKMWIQLLIPRIEDGNNFGVSIQEDTLAELRQVESETGAYLDQISRYFITRAKLISKVAKYPHVEDYRRSVSEIDEKEFLNLRLTCAELRNTYLSLYDLIMKNKEKIKKPRNSNAETLY